MKVCFVDGCSGPKTEDPVFFEFPTSRLQRKRWLDAINSSSKLYQEAVVCIRHFDSKDYELVRGKTRLKSKVVPSLRVGEKVENNENKDTSQISTESATNDNAAHNEISGQDTISNTDNDNDNVHNNSEKLYNDDGKLHNDNGNVHNDSEKLHNNNENVPNDSEKLHNDNGNVHNDSEKLHNDNGNVHNDSEKLHNDNGKLHNDNEDHKEVSSGTGDNEEVPSDDKNTQKCTENGQIDSSHKDNEKVNNENGDNRLDNNDNGTVNNDNGVSKNKEIPQNDTGKVQNNKKTRCKITAMRVVNGRRGSSRDSVSSSQDSVSSSPPHNPEMEGSKEDIEEALTNYYIENKKTERQVAAMTDVLEEERRELNERDGLWEQRAFEPSEPVFIELSVGQGKPTEGEPAENDCLMVLESVQCDVDPALLLAAREDMDEDIEQVDIGDDDDDEPVLVVNKKEDPISLLTSSDEDEVIIQEPKIDIVEVSSADTSEDDMPLVKLLKRRKSSKKAKAKRHKKLITKLLWGGTDFYCVHCRYTTVDSAEYTQHMATHSKVLQVCQDCGLTTSSKAQMVRHKQKHKNERRFKCQRCNYSAKHEMSLVYHMKTHSGQNEVELAICDTYRPASKRSRPSERSKASEKSTASEKSKASVKSKLSERDDKKHKCDLCGYKTKRRSDLKRHKKAIHSIQSTDGDDEDDEYIL